MKKSKDSEKNKMNKWKKQKFRMWSGTSFIIVI